MRADMLENTTITLAMAVTSSANTIFLIDCLSAEDLQTARRRHEGICDELMSLPPSGFQADTSRVVHLRCQTREDWDKGLNKIRDVCKNGLSPLLFIDGHGDERRGLLMPSGESVSWEIYLRDLRAITYAARGELTVIAAFCYSLAVKPMLKGKKGKLPFAFYFGYANEISAGIVEKETRILYESLLRNGGETLQDEVLELSCFDEYEHAIDAIAHVVMMQTAPRMLVSIDPRFSRAKLRAKVGRDLAAEGVKMAGYGKAINKAIRNPKALAMKLIEDVMHDTDRRRDFIRDIQKAMRPITA
jgi:bacterioferritin (cytochrome b1)